jgi:hypothetical protein
MLARTGPGHGQIGKGWLLLETREQARVHELDPALERGVSPGVTLRLGMEFGTDEREDHLGQLLVQFFCLGRMEAGAAKRAEQRPAEPDRVRARERAGE